MNTVKIGFVLDTEVQRYHHGMYWPTISMAKFPTGNVLGDSFGTELHHYFRARSGNSVYTFEIPRHILDAHHIICGPTILTLEYAVDTKGNYTDLYVNKVENGVTYYYVRSTDSKFAGCEPSYAYSNDGSIKPQLRYTEEQLAEEKRYQAWVDKAIATDKQAKQDAVIKNLTLSMEDYEQFKAALNFIAKETDQYVLRPFQSRKTKDAYSALVIKIFHKNRALVLFVKDGKIIVASVRQTKDSRDILAKSRKGYKYRPNASCFTSHSSFKEALRDLLYRKAKAQLENI